MEQPINDRTKHKFSFSIILFHKLLNLLLINIGNTKNLRLRITTSTSVLGKTFKIPQCGIPADSYEI